MSEFGYIRLSDIAHIEMGQSPDSNYVSDNLDIGIPFLQGNAEFGTSNPEPKYSCTNPTKLCHQGDVLISVRAPVGQINVADRPFCVGRGLAAIRIKNQSPVLAAKIIEKASPDLRRVAQGTTFEAISKSDLLSLKVQMPPENEWLILEGIFNSLDTAIQQTEAIIEKLKQVKQGLLHDLLTRGIDSNGNLRPTYEEAPELYKESVLGWVPREWRVSTVGAEFEIQLGKMLDAEKNSGTLKPYLGNKSVQWDRIDTEDVQLMAMSRADLERFRLKQGDLLVCEGGEVGRAAIWENELDECYYQKALHRLRPKNEFNPRLMLELLRYWMSNDKLSEYVSRTSIAHLTQEKLSVIPLPCPLPTEQTLIVGMVGAQKTKMENEICELEKLNTLKAGLMDDLLTGRVRLTGLAEEGESNV